MSNTRALAATLVALTVAVCGRPSAALAQDAKLVIEWNRTLFSVAPPGPPVVIRPAAMLHIAMFDAVNAIERAYTPYRFEVRASRGASQEAAAAQAAHDVLTALFPTQHAIFDSLLDSQLANLPPGREKQGIAIGRAVARQCSNGGRTTAAAHDCARLHLRASADPACGSQRRRRLASPRSLSWPTSHRSASSRARSFCRLRHPRSPASAMRRTLTKSSPWG